MKKYSLNKTLWTFVGILSFILGTIGAFLPIIPTVPFYLLAVFSFTKANSKLKDKFIRSSLYKKYLSDYKKDGKMNLKTKIKILLTISIVFFIAFIMMKNTILGRFILAIVYLIHLYYFIFKVKTK